MLEPFSGVSTVGHDLDEEERVLHLQAQESIDEVSESSEVDLLEDGMEVGVVGISEEIDFKISVSSTDSLEGVGESNELSRCESSVLEGMLSCSSDDLSVGSFNEIDHL